MSATLQEATARGAAIFPRILCATAHIDRDANAVRQAAIVADVAKVVAETGQRPLVLDEQAPPVQTILAAAASTGASLIVMGSRPGQPAASVSQAVARRAPCSVLVLRQGGVT